MKNLNTISIIVLAITLIISSFTVWKLDARVASLETQIDYLQSNTAVRAGAKLGEFFEELNK